MNLATLGLGVALAALSASILPMMLPADGDNSPVGQRVNDVDTLDGIWRSRGYGWVVKVRNGRARFYDESVNLCLRAENADLDLNDLDDRLLVSNDGSILHMAFDDPAYHYTFDRIDALPDACGEDHEATPHAVFDAAIGLFSNHYAFFKERNVDLPDLAKGLRNDLHPDASDDQLINAIGAVVSTIDDAHVSLEAERDGYWMTHETGDGTTLARVAAQAAREGLSVRDMQERWQELFWTRDMAEILGAGDQYRALDGRLVYGLVGDDIGYLALSSMEGFTGRDRGAEVDVQALDRAMERVLDLFGGVEAIIVDIAMNDGGYDRVARALAGRFAAERTVGYYKYAGDAATAEPQALYVEPSDGRRFTGPVYLVTSGYSVSAAEIFTLSMRALPNVTHVGETTRGSLSDVLFKALPNGWSLSLSNEVYLDADGQRWEGIGIAPQVALDVFSADDVTRGHVDTVDALVDAIRSGNAIAPQQG